MAKISDPDFLNQWTEVSINPTGKFIALNKAGNLTDDGVTLQALYSFLKEEWRSDSTLIKYAFPLEGITPEQFEIKGGWDFSGDGTKNLIRDGGWARKDINGLTAEEYMNLVTLGSFYATGDKTYYQQSSVDGAINAVFAGPVNQAIKIYDSGGANSRGYLKIFLREQGKNYDSYDLISQQNISNLTYKKYALPLSNSLDLKIAQADSFIATGHPYTGISISYSSAPVSKQIGASSYLFNKVIDGFSADKIEIYEKIQYLLRQNVDIDISTGIATGKLTDELLQFVGDTLKTKQGVFIENVQSDDINSVEFVDVSGVVRTYPFTSAGSIIFNDNLKNDPSSKYWMYFTTNPGGNFGTSNAILVQDKDSLNITGSINGQNSVSFTFNYDSNSQGGRTPATNADVTIVAIGLTGAQYVSTTSAVTRSTSNSISLVSPQERNYENL